MKFNLEQSNFIDLLLAVTLHWNLPTLPNNAQIDGHLPKNNVMKFIL